ISALLEQKVLRTCISTCNSPVWLVRKPNGSWRLTVDYRRLNSVTPPMAPIVADITHLATKLQPSHSFSSVLDISNGFWSLPLHPLCQYKFAFTFQETQHTWTCLPQGFHNSPALFHSVMKDALASFPYQQNLVQYVDDHLLASPDLKSHIIHLKALLTALTKAGLKINPDKAQLCRQQVSFLGITITPSGRAIDQHKLSVILSLPLPTDVTSLRSFLGMCNFMHLFVFNFSVVCKPLYTLLRADNSFTWTEDHTEAITTLKQALTSAPVLSAPNYLIPFHLFIANSFSSLAAVLAQSDCELAALIQALSDHQDQAVTIYSDSSWTVMSAASYLLQWHKNGFLSSDGKPLKHQHMLKMLFVLLKTRQDSQLDTIMVKIKAYTYGSAVATYNNTVDGLAKQAAVSGHCWVVPDIDLSTIQTTTPVAAVAVTLPDDLKALQDMDPTIHNMVTMDPHVVCIEGIFYRTDPTTGCPVYIPPVELRSLLITNIHARGHLAAESTYRTLAQSFWWPRMWKDVEKYCSYCIPCAMLSPPARKIQGPLPIRTSDGPWSSIFIDYIDGMPRSPGGHTHILVVVRAFTKWVEAFPITKTSAKATAKVLLDLFCRWGIPASVDSDRGPHFANEVMKQALQALGVKHHLHIPYRPQASGQVERVNRTLKASIKRICLEQRATWVESLPWLLMALRSRVDKRTGYSPFQVMMGRVMWLPENLL
uniref:Gypsy retrotransposon integrase-like protein 1 n=1 Tax=Latimeria chalumnae TaxID=7897 RepID=H3AT24_LATCH